MFSTACREPSVSPALLQAFMRSECICISGWMFASFTLFRMEATIRGNTARRSSTVVMAMPHAHGSPVWAEQNSTRFSIQPTGVTNEPSPSSRSSPRCATPLKISWFNAKPGGGGDKEDEWVSDEVHLLHQKPACVSPPCIITSSSLSHALRQTGFLRPRHIHTSGVSISMDCKWCVLRPSRSLSMPLPGTLLICRMGVQDKEEKSDFLL